MRRILPIALTTLLCAPLGAHATPLCGTMGEIAATAAYLRQTGAPQTTAAQEGARLIEQVVNTPEARRHLTSMERHQLAQGMAGMARDVIQMVYSIPPETRREEKAAAVLAAQVWVEQSCMAMRPM